MLPPAHRMRRRSDFALAVKAGPRAGGRLLVLHGCLQPGSDPLAPALVGFVVPKSVGNAVVRNRVQRRLRHLLNGRVAELPGASRIVVRVLPAASSASSPELESELSALLTRLAKRLAPERVEVRS